RRRRSSSARWRRSTNPTAVAICRVDIAHRYRGCDDYIAGARGAALHDHHRRAFAIVALAPIGVYGVIAYATKRRRCEFGVRVALGAHPPQVTGLVLREGAGFAAAGIVGLLGAAAAARLLQHPALLPSAFKFLPSCLSASNSCLPAFYLPALPLSRMIRCHEEPLFRRPRRCHPVYFVSGRAVRLA